MKRILVAAIVACLMGRLSAQRKAPSPLRPPGDPLKVRLDVAYNGTILRWNHIESMRWNIFYNYLVADSLLLLAWAAVFAAQPGDPTWVTFKLGVLFLLALMGLFASWLWQRLGHRHNVLVDNAAVAGYQCERLHLPDDPRLRFAPLRKQKGQSEEDPLPLRTDWGYHPGDFGSGWVVVLVPVAFEIVYTALMVGVLWIIGAEPRF